MKDLNVKEFIELLKTHPQDAIVCVKCEVDPVYITPEQVRYSEEETYINFEGDEIKGNILIII